MGHFKMSRYHWFGSLFCFGLVLFLAGFGFAGVERFEITSRETIEDGKSFGLAGPFELLYGKAHFAIDPDASGNKLITDLDKAARDAGGQVRYSAGFYILKPVNSDRGNGTLFLDIPNRGGPTALAFNFPHYAMLDPNEPPPPLGDGFLMRHGFTVAGVGWQADVPKTNPRVLSLYPPIAGSVEVPVEGLARADAVFSNNVKTMPLGHWQHEAYPVSDPKDPRNVLTVRNTRLGKRTVIPREQWRFGRWEENGIVPDKAAVALVEGSFEKGQIYEIVYVSRNPRIIGLGLTAVRDFVAYLRYDEQSPVSVSRALAFGASQSGRFLRHLTYLGLNSDHLARPVLDGILTSVAGAGRGSFNHRFGQPSRASLTFLTFFFPTDIFPFTGTVVTDGTNGRKDGLFTRLAGSDAMPKIIQVNTGSEYWGRAGSLIHTSVDGKTDQLPLSNERIFHLAGIQHFSGALPPTKVHLPFTDQQLIGRHPTNPANFMWFERAMLLALNEWIAKGFEPPPSRYPKIADGTLIPPESYTFPAIPGVQAPRKAYTPLRLDYGPRFTSRGIIDHQPPKPGSAYPVLVPRVDEDGIEMGGLRLPEVAVPVATLATWNWRDEEIGAGSELLDMAGSFFPFARTRAERQDSGDPRLSLEERYANRSDYIGQFTEASLELVRQRYLLAEDLPQMIRFAGKLWDVAHQEKEKQAPPPHGN